MSESLYLKNRDIPLKVKYGSAGQVSYQYAVCPICKWPVKIMEGRKKSYCSQCGQLLLFDFTNEFKMQSIKKVMISFRFQKSDSIGIKIVEATTIKEAILNFYDSYTNRCEIISVREEGSKDIE